MRIVSDTNNMVPDAQTGFWHAVPSWLCTLAHNAAAGAALVCAFRAGDNFGFHMGDDDLGQCTCQWSPGRGDPFRGSTRCEQDADHEPAVCPGCCADRDGDCVCWQQDVTP